MKVLVALGLSLALLPAEQHREAGKLDMKPTPFTVRLRTKGPPRTYVGRVVTEWLENGRTMRLLEEFGFHDSRGFRWQAPKGAVIDGASIPRIAWTAIGGPFEGLYRDASVIHDVACDEKVEPWQLVHEVFYEAMLVSKVPELKAKLMYGAVYHFGPRWPLKDPVGWKSTGGDPRVTELGVGPPQSPLTDRNFEFLLGEIERLHQGKTGGSLAEVREISIPR
jgi:hypothetical protein